VAHLFLLGLARAALLDSLLCVGLERGHDLHERRFGFSIAVNFSEGRSVSQSETGTFAVALAAFLFVLDVASGFGALELAFRSWASRRLGARPRARRLFAQRGALRFRSDARSVALSRSADGLTLGARFLFAHVLRATNRAFGLLAVNSAFGASGLLALHLTFGTSTDGMADSRARGVITLPTADGVAILALLSPLDFRVDFSVYLSGDGERHERQQKHCHQLHCA
jgi:hypothetical protein